ncbi:unnamed protein product [Fraxinus pennsylvanica]|uniref:30S ribosomal protein S6 alpha, chloroplastic n=1 Tax=Fraxinus pennsylvanica TaxID=56036 RepID=A0AAD2A9T7_9LAMI|nr:unnamed protein product [Fraxinus pennsylvanica]
MANSSTSLISSAFTVPKLPHNYPQFSSYSTISFSSRAQFFLETNPRKSLNYFARSRGLVVKAEFDISLFQRDISGTDDPPPAIPGSGFPDVEEKEEPQCPPGLRQYETMVVLRPDMSEDERLAFTQKYEELLVAGGGMYVEVFNRGVIPLAYSIRKKNKAGETNTYLDGIYLLFTYFTKPESMEILGETLQADDDVIRSSSFKIRKRKLF